MPKPLSHRHRAITEDDLVFFCRVIADHPSLSRRRLSAKLCEAWRWVQPNGALRDMVCRGMMLMLHREGLIELPAVQFVPRNPVVERNAPSVVDVDQTALHTSLVGLGRWTFGRFGAHPMMPCSTACSSSTTTLAIRSRWASTYGRRAARRSRPCPCLRRSSTWGSGARPAGPGGHRQAQRPELSINRPLYRQEEIYQR